MKRGLCTARMGAILADALGRARASDLRASMLKRVNVFVCEKGPKVKQQ